MNRGRICEGVQIGGDELSEGIHRGMSDTGGEGRNRRDRDPGNRVARAEHIADSNDPFVEGYLEDSLQRK